MPEIRLSRLTKRYGAVEVLHGIDLEMAENEFTVLVGPSGCGKSTTLRMIAGLESVSEGEIFIGGSPVSHLDPKDRGLAMVFQDYALYPHMDVAHNISFALRLQRRPKAEIEAKVREVADVVGLTGFLHRKPGALSGGQRQRVAMARALAKDSDIFLFDEPLSNLDAKLRGQMRAELAIMQQRVRKNMIYVTHDQVEAMTLADRIVVMHDGHIQQQGTPEALFKRPVNRFVAGFLGSPPMNFLEVELEEADGKIFAASPDVRVEIVGDLAVRARRQGSRHVVLGIRPSDLSHQPEEVRGRTIRLKVLVSEYIGTRSVLICECGQASIAVEVKSETPVALGELAPFVVRNESVHLFEQSTELAI
ncbi:MAG: ABC transporter ATP-binding protein [Boseongicola sp. SB0677_bin_26]|nr:ABC transporter ATP-binding protein [Boseongicola sp. SB0665_bin_10]MYG25603.1 ABC transporter ATP-binding protein [Boseongicola sp. SB0677_bin_26]